MIDFSLSESQVILQRNARAALREMSPISAVREWEKSADGYDRGIYRHFAGLGWIDLLAPGADGGQGNAWIEAVLIYEELGRTLFPSPLYPSTVCARLIALFGSAVQKSSLLEPIITGEAAIAPAFWERSAKSDLRMVQTAAQRRDGGYVLDGEKRAVEFGHAVDQLLVAVTVEGGDTPFGLAVVDANAAGVAASRIDSLGGEPRALVRLDGVEIPADRLIPLAEADLVAFDQTLLHLRLLRAAELLGVAGGALDLAVSYANTRVQYGRPVSTFQALQHKLANCTTRLDLMRLPVAYAAWALSEDQPADGAVAEALVKTGEMAQYVTAESVQTHGGLGVIDNSEVSVFYRRAKARQVELGFPDVLRERIAVELGL